MGIWLLARAAGASLPRRLVYVVDRRAVVDQATDFAEKIRETLRDRSDLEQVRIGLRLGDRPLAISTLRGQHRDNREWLTDPAAPAIIVGTVDMVGSRLLFEGYGVSRKMRPYAAGLMGCDTLVLLDEAHLSRPFERLLKTIEEEQRVSTTGSAGASRGCFTGSRASASVPPPFRVLPLSATLGNAAETAQAFSINDADLNDETVSARLNAAKTLQIEKLNDAVELPIFLAKRAWCLASKQAEAAAKPVRMLIYCDKRKDAEQVADHLCKRAKDEAPKTAVILFVGGRRFHEREAAADQLKEHGFIADADTSPSASAFLVSTSAGEVGVDLDADHMVCDLVPWERMVQRLGRVNRRGKGMAQVLVLDQLSPDTKNQDEATNTRLRAVRELLELLPPLDDRGSYQAGPGALIGLRENADAGQLLDKATTPLPLHPELTRPLIDAWAMTSLVEHAGRPEVGPWLRGWVDEEPQTTLVWRRHLPVLWGTSGVEPQPMAPRDVEAFIEAAAPQADEMLETEARRVWIWLKQRVAKLPEASAKPDDSTSGLPPLTRSAPIAYLIRNTGRPEHISRQSIIDSGKNGDDLSMRKRLAGQMLVVDARLGGLADGLLVNRKGDVQTIEDNWGNPLADEGGESDSDGRAAIQVEVRGERDETNSGRAFWREALTLPCCVGAEGMPVKWLVVKQWRREGDDTRSLALLPQTLKEHQAWAAEEAASLASALGLCNQDQMMLAVAAQHHDDGKKATIWQRAFNAPYGDDYAKTSGPVNRRSLQGYRHEFQSVLDAEKNGLEGLDPLTPRHDLALHLIAAHHGHARPAISVKGCESLPPTAAAPCALEVALRFARLQQQWGPWGLAWWEALLRAVDWKASKRHDARSEKNNESLANRKSGGGPKDDAKTSEWSQMPLFPTSGG